MDGMKRPAMTPTRPRASAAAAPHEATDAAATTLAAAPPIDVFCAGTKRKRSGTPQPANSESVVSALATGEKVGSTTQRDLRKRIKASPPDLAAVSAQRPPRAANRSRVASFSVVAEARRNDDGLGPSDAVTVVVTRANADTEHIVLCPPQGPRQAQVPDCLWSYLIDQPEAGTLRFNCKFVILHALLAGFIPSLKNAADARDILQLIGRGAAKRAADEVVTTLACCPSEAFLDYFLSIWKNPNASVLDVVVFPALTFSVQQGRLAEARVLVRHGADPLLDRVNLADEFETVISPWKRVFARPSGPKSRRCGSQEMEDLLRAAIISSGRKPPRH